MAVEVVSANSHTVDSQAYAFEFNQSNMSMRITEKNNSNLSFLVWGDPHQTVQVKDENGGWINHQAISYADFYSNRSYLLEDGSKVEVKTVPGQGAFAGGKATFTNEVIITSADGLFAVHATGLYRDHELAQGRSGEMTVRILRDDKQAARQLDNSSADSWLFTLTDGDLARFIEVKYPSISHHLTAISRGRQIPGLDMTELRLNMSNEYGNEDENQGGLAERRNRF